ncbi:hypothetical protein D3C81_880290 [compost metagenome]
MKQLKEQGFSKTFTVALVKDRPFYEGKDNSGIYDYFRGSKVVQGRVYKPTDNLRIAILLMLLGCIELIGDYWVIGGTSL